MGNGNDGGTASEGMSRSNTARRSRPDSARGKNLTETEKIQMVLSQGNFFGDDDANSAELEHLQAQNRRLKKRVDKLQTINNSLKTAASTQKRENAKVVEMKDEIKTLKKRMAEMEAEHKKTVQTRDREIHSLKRNKVRLQNENLNISRSFEEKIKVLEERTRPLGDDEEILSMIEECGDDVEKLKETLLSGIVWRWVWMDQLVGCMVDMVTCVGRRVFLWVSSRSLV